MKNAILLLLPLLLAGSNLLWAESSRALRPDAIVDLRTVTGAAGVDAQWRDSDTVIQQIEHRDVGPDLKASGRPNQTFDFFPDARASDFDDSKWEVIPADSLEQ